MIPPTQNLNSIHNFFISVTRTKLTILFAYLIIRGKNENFVYCMEEIIIIIILFETKDL